MADYEQNGLLYCGTCHEPKEKIYILGINKTTYKGKCMCKCDRQKLEEKEKAEKLRKKQEAIYQMRQECFEDKRPIVYTFDIDDKKNTQLSEFAKDYADNFENYKKRGQGILFYGGVGTGKTFMAACIINALLDKEYRCLSTNFFHLANEIIATKNKIRYMDNLNNYALILLDDLGVERDTDFMDDIVMQIVDSRYRNNKPVLITTNLTMSDLLNADKMQKKRTYSRILEMCIPFNVDGNDRRREYVL